MGLARDGASSCCPRIPLYPEPEIEKREALRQPRNNDTTLAGLCAPVAISSIRAPHAVCSRYPRTGHEDLAA